MEEPFKGNFDQELLEGEGKHLKPLGIQGPLIPLPTLVSDWLKPSIFPISLRSVPPSTAYLGAATHQGLIAPQTPQTASDDKLEENIAPIPDPVQKVAIAQPLPQIPQILQDLSVIDSLMVEVAETEQSLAQTGHRRVKIASSDRLHYAPIPFSSDQSPAIPDAWSSMTDLLGNVHPPENEHPNLSTPISSPSIPLSPPQTITHQIAHPRRSSSTINSQNIELLAREVYAYIQQNLALEPESNHLFNHPSSSGKLPW